MCEVRGCEQFLNECFLSVFTKEKDMEDSEFSEGYAAWKYLHFRQLHAPKDWKITNIVPSFKKNRDMPDNYTRVSLMKRLGNY